MRQVEGQAISLRNHIQGDVGRHVAATWVRPSTGYPYARCPQCRKQIFARVARSATFVQTVLLLKQNMAVHMKTEHGSEGGTGD